MAAELASALLWLLLPVAAASGWLAARRPRRGHRVGSFAGDYFRGINYLLNEQPDKAIEVFIQLLDVDGETVETHLALGNLFRRRGEVDRAIRIHQNLIAKTNLSHEQRCHALLELAMDYMRSGLLDRAESLFRELLDLRMNTEQALTQLVLIYQQEQDWDKAIEIARQLETHSGQRLGAMIAHFVCEKAEGARAAGDLASAASLAREALALDPGCVRASLFEGALATASGRLEDAIAAYARVEQQDPQFLPAALHLLVDCHRRRGRIQELRAWLEQVGGEHPGLTPALALAALAAEAGDLRRAMECIAGELQRHPSVRGIDRYLEYAIGTAAGASRDDLALLKGFTARLLEHRPAYRCEHCGFAGRSLHWQCPGCKSWNSVKPLHDVEDDQAR